jgi:tetratricopeptide (TPR) repeat protein
MSFILGYDPTTLREQVDLLAVGQRLEELGRLRSLDAMCERAWLLAVAGQADDSLTEANSALRLARFTGERRDALRPRIIRGFALQLSGRLDEALQELGAVVDLSHTEEWHELEATALHRRGTVFFDKGEYEDALSDFQASLRLREAHGASLDQLEGSLVGVETVEKLLRARR